MKSLACKNIFLNHLKTIGISFLFTLTSLASGLDSDTEVIARLIILEKASFPQPPYMSKTINHADIGVVIEKRPKCTTYREYQHIRRGNSSGLKECFWALSATFGPADDAYISTFFLSQKKKARIDIRYIYDENNKPKKIRRGDPFKIKNVSDLSANETNLLWLKRSIFEWVLPNSNEKSLGDFIEWFQDSSLSFRQKHIYYKSTSANCTTFALNVLKDLDLLPDFNLFPISSNEKLIKTAISMGCAGLTLSFLTSSVPFEFIEWTTSSTSLFINGSLFGVSAASGILNIITYCDKNYKTDDAVRQILSFYLNRNDGPLLTNIQIIRNGTLFDTTYKNGIFYINNFQNKEDFKDLYLEYKEDIDSQSTFINDNFY